MGHAKGFASFFGRETSANWVFFGRRYDARKIKTPGSLGTTSHNAFEEVKIETLPGSSSVLAGISSQFSKTIWRQISMNRPSSPLFVYQWLSFLSICSIFVQRGATAGLAGKAAPYTAYSAEFAARARNRFWLADIFGDSMVLQVTQL